jgi:hypothetical protein
MVCLTPLGDFIDSALDFVGASTGMNGVAALATTPLGDNGRDARSSVADTGRGTRP